MRILRGTALKTTGSAIALVSAGVAMTTATQAGGFAIREQSAYYQGMSFAGAGTGDTLSSMYWNSAAAAAAPGMNSEPHVSLIVPDTEITATDGVLTGGGCAFGNCESGSLADGALVPASYANYQLSDQLYLGIAMNSGFGLITKPDNTSWAGSAIAITSDVFSINANPTIAYRVTPDFAVGVGVQIEYINVGLTNGAAPAPVAIALGKTGPRTAELDDIGIGATAGATWTPSAGTTIGVGYRSSIDFDLEGSYSGDPFGPTGAYTGGANAELTLPDMVTIGLRQQLTDRLTALAGYEWTNWSVLEVAELYRASDGGLQESLPFHYKNGHFVSLGLEYAHGPDTMLRTGIAWEKSPITDEERNVLLPDTDRIWLSVGATHQLSENITIDVGYTHIFVDDAPISLSAPGGAPLLLEADADSAVDILAASFRYKWGGGEPDLEPFK
ncbi:MAG: OmpP1/FadL family transporter [Rhodomicrobiaceae bacterium]